jgi:hypothetical protein
MPVAKAAQPIGSDQCSDLLISKSRYYNIPSGIGRKHFSKVRSGNPDRQREDEQLWSVTEEGGLGPAAGFSPPRCRELPRVWRAEAPPQAQAAYEIPQHPGEVAAGSKHSAEPWIGGTPPETITGRAHHAPEESGCGISQCGAKKI